MILEYYIVGGVIKIKKNVFTREMLCKDSLIRTLLSWRGTRDFAFKHPSVSEPDEDQMITIHFSLEAEVHITDSPKEILSALKAKLKNDIRGKVACRTEYAMFGGIFTYEIDLNSKDDQVEYVNM